MTSDGFDSEFHSKSGPVKVSVAEDVNTSRAYIKPIKNKRKNLKVSTLTYVTKVLFQGNTAVGVEFKKGSKNIEELKKRSNSNIIAVSNFNQ